MKQSRFLLFSVLLTALSFPSVCQQFLFFRFTDGTSGIYPLPQVKKLGFEGSGLKLQLSDGTEYSW